MASVKNMLKVLKRNNILVLVVVAALGYALYAYSQNKKSLLLQMGCSMQPALLILY